MSHEHRFSLMDVGAGVLGLAVLGAVAAPMCGLARSDAKAQRDAVQVRGMIQACQVWAGSNQGSFPLPSLVDLSHRTVAGTATSMETKNDSGNIVSLLIWNGLVSTEQVISPKETNPAIKVDGGYEFANPSRAISPSEALWDPGFSGTPEPEIAARRAAGVGNVSYAHQIPFSLRRARWRDDAPPQTVQWANRGPTFDGSYINDSAFYAENGWRLLPSPPSLGIRAFSVQFYPAYGEWRGYRGFADGAVHFGGAAEAWPTYRRTGSRAPLDVPDNLFVAESDDSTTPPSPTPFPMTFGGRNNYLRLVSKVTGNDAFYTPFIFRD